MSKPGLRPGERANYGRYGEPWIVQRDGKLPVSITICDGRGVDWCRCYDSPDDDPNAEGWSDRAAACVNALAGISDPAAFVQAAKELYVQAKAESGAVFDGCICMQKTVCEFHAALAAMEGAMR